MSKQLPTYTAQVVQKIQAAMAANKMCRGREHTISIAHDDGCLLLRGRGPCTCHPTVGEPEPVPLAEDN